MTEDGRAPEGKGIIASLLKGFWPWLQEIPKAVLITITAGAVIVAATWIWNWFQTSPSTWSAGTTREWSVRPLLAAAKSELAEPCDRSAPVRWLNRQLFGLECIRLIVDPAELHDMFSVRGSFRETGDPYHLLELFIEHHKGCLTLGREEEKAMVSESQPSRIERTDGRLVCR